MLSPYLTLSDCLPLMTGAAGAALIGRGTALVGRLCRGPGPAVV